MDTLSLLKKLLVPQYDSKNKEANVSFEEVETVGLKYDEIWKRQEITETVLQAMKDSFPEIITMSLCRQNVDLKSFSKFPTYFPQLINLDLRENQNVLLEDLTNLKGLKLRELATDIEYDENKMEVIFSIFPDLIVYNLHPVGKGVDILLSSFQEQLPAHWDQEKKFLKLNNIYLVERIMKKFISLAAKKFLETEILSISLPNSLPELEIISDLHTLFPNLHTLELIASNLNEIFLGERLKNLKLRELICTNLQSLVEVMRSCPSLEYVNGRSVNNPLEVSSFKSGPPIPWVVDHSIAPVFPEFYSSFPKLVRKSFSYFGDTPSFGRTPNSTTTFAATLPFGFGSTTTTSFGSTNISSPFGASRGFGFGSTVNTTATPSTGFSFATNNLTTSTFGSTANTTTFGATAPATGGFSFGGLTTSNTPSFGTPTTLHPVLPFGASTTQSTPSFGSTANNTSSPFGTSATTTSPFGASSTPSTGFSFANNPTTTTTFGTSTTTTTPFGGTANTTSSPFGTSSTPSTGFSVTANNPTPSFGASATTTTPFGGTANTTSSPFGGTANNTSSPFGGTANTTSSPFGTSSTPQATLPFGNANPPIGFSTATPVQNPFGSYNSTPAPSSFALAPPILKFPPADPLNKNAAEKKYKPFTEFDSATGSTAVYVAITANPEYQDYSFEELRWGNGNPKSPFKGNNIPTPKNWKTIISSMADDETFKDCAFIEGEEKITFHRNILAGISAPMKKLLIENKDLKEIKSPYSIEVMKAIVSFCYTEAAVILNANPEQLLAASKDLQIDELFAAAELNMIADLERFKVEKVLETFRYAKEKEAFNLLSATCTAILKSYSELKESGQFEKISKDELLDILQEAGKIFQNK